MYDPLLNSVLVEIDDKDSEWGSGNDESMLGASFSKGKLIKVPQQIIQTEQYPLDMEGAAYLTKKLEQLVDKSIMWNEGTEAGTVFEHEGKKYGFIYWWDIRGVAVDA
jgi:hypothetical protein